MFLQISLPQLQSDTPISWTNELGHSIIKKVEFLIGGVVIDTRWRLVRLLESILMRVKKLDIKEMVKCSESFDNYTQK